MKIQIRRGYRGEYGQLSTIEGTALQCAEAIASALSGRGTTRSSRANAVGTMAHAPLGLWEHLHAESDEFGGGTNPRGRLHAYAKCRLMEATLNDRQVFAAFYLRGIYPDEVFLNRVVPGDYRHKQEFFNEHGSTRTLTPWVRVKGGFRFVVNRSAWWGVPAYVPSIDELGAPVWAGASATRAKHAIGALREAERKLRTAGLLEPGALIARMKSVAPNVGQYELDHIRGKTPEGEPGREHPVDWVLRVSRGKAVQPTREEILAALSIVPQALSAA